MCVSAAPSDVAYRRQCGRHLLDVSSSHFDPKRSRRKLRVRTTRFIHRSGREVEERKRRYVRVRLLHVPSVDRTQGMLDRVLLCRCVGQCNKAYHCRSIANHRPAVRPTYRGSPSISLALESCDLVCSVPHVVTPANGSISVTRHNARQPQRVSGSAVMVCQRGAAATS